MSGQCGRTRSGVNYPAFGGCLAQSEPVVTEDYVDPAIEMRQDAAEQIAQDTHGINSIPGTAYASRMGFWDSSSQRHHAPMRLEASLEVHGRFIWS